MVGEEPRATDLLVVRDQLGERSCGIRNIVGLAEPGLGADAAKGILPERLRQCVRFAQIPRLEFLTRDAESGQSSSGRSEHSSRRYSFSSMQSPPVIVSHHHEPDAGLLPGAEFSGDALFQIALPFVGHALKDQTREQARQKPVEKRLHRVLFEKEYHPAHHGPAPLKSPCLHRVPNLSPSSTNAFSSLLLEARQTLVKPSSLASQ